MRIGILGGTFNPVHNGHLYIAKRAFRKLCLDRVIFIPAYVPPHKKITGNTSVSDRVRMLKLATSGEKRFSVSEYEARKKRTSYSVNTARYLKKKFGKHSELFFIIGADSLAGLTSWKGIAKLCKLLQFVAVPRQGFRFTPTPRFYRGVGVSPHGRDSLVKGATGVKPWGSTAGCYGVIKLSMPQKNISSSMIRDCIKKGEPINQFVPNPVLRYIRENGLYAYSVLNLI